MKPVEFKSQIVRRLTELGFDGARVAKPDAVAGAGVRLQRFLDAGWHGGMDWMEANRERRADPRTLWPAVRSVIVAGMNYGPERDPLDVLKQRSRGAVSVYARNRDYHDVIKGRLKQVAGWMHQTGGADVKVFVDTAPVLEKPLAAAAGTGWQGKHTNLVSRQFGSWLFLGTIFTDAELPADDPETDHCGSCRACLDICPTDAFPEPYQLDARRCISYLTIEHKGTIAPALRRQMGNRIYGCDDCLAVCPWNKFARSAHETRFHARADLEAPALAELAELDDTAFRARFSGSPIKRIGRARFLRNVMIAAGNSNDRELLPVVRARLDDEAGEVRAMAVWAMGELTGAKELAALAADRLTGERDRAVRREWQAVLKRAGVPA